MPIKLIRDPLNEAADADFVICMRVADVPIPSKPAIIMRCAECGERVWFANSSPRQPKRICWQCAAPILSADKEPELMMTPGIACAIVTGKDNTELIDRLDAAADTEDEP